MEIKAKYPTATYGDEWLREFSRRLQQSRNVMILTETVKVSEQITESFGVEEIIFRTPVYSVKDVLELAEAMACRSEAERKGLVKERYLNSQKS